MVRALRAVVLAPDWTIYERQMAYVVTGPVMHGASLKYEIQHRGDLTRGLRPDMVIGWIPKDEAEAALVAIEPVCPTVVRSILDVAGLQPFERLVCFGDREITLSEVRRSDPRPNFQPHLGLIGSPSCMNSGL